jgi:hypothetical protein
MLLPTCATHATAKPYSWQAKCIRSWRAQGLLARVANTGPLVSLLLAGDFREEFLRMHRDLSSSFTLLGTGEKLLVSLARVLGRSCCSCCSVWGSAGTSCACTAASGWAAPPEQLLHTAGHRASVRDKLLLRGGSPAVLLALAAAEVIAHVCNWHAALVSVTLRSCTPPQSSSSLRSAGVHMFNSCMYVLAIAPVTCAQCSTARRAVLLLLTIGSYITCLPCRA